VTDRKPPRLPARSLSARSAPRPTPRPPSPASGSLYERYKDALRRGHVASLRGRLDAAIDAYSEAASIATDRALPHASIGGILARMGRPTDALAAYERALNLSSRDETALRGRAEMLGVLGLRVEAAEALDRLAAMLDAAGRLPDACDAAGRALELAESKVRRQYIESLAARLRESDGDEAAQRALAQVLRFLEPPAMPEPQREPTSVTPVAVDEVWAPEPETWVPEPEPERQPEPELPDGVVLGAAAEDALYAGDRTAARDGLLAAAEAHRRVGRSAAAIDACYLALAVAPADVDLHLLLAEIYVERGWRTLAIDKLLLLGRLAELAGDDVVRQRLCGLVTDQLPDEPRLAGLCA
jgi:tetratricopeptide (TPR) repeat protein